MVSERALLERDDVTAAARQVVSRVAAVGPGALFVVGEAGLGKTSIIELACADAAAAGLAVGLGRGHPMEASLPFGLLSQALDSVGGFGLLEEEPPISATAGDQAARFYRVLRWLRSRTASPLLLAIDDMHWSDADSLALISFLCRRLPSLRVGLIATMRPWPADARQVVAALADEGCGSIRHLAPLTEAAAGMLIEDLLGRPLTVAARHRASELCAGNPLLLQQLALALGHGGELPDSFAGGSSSFGSTMLLARFAGLAPTGMRCAQAASVLGTGFLPEIAAQVAGLAENEVEAAVESLGRTGLIGQQAGGLADFAHPLFRQALYNDLAVPTRTRLHARAFAVLRERGMEAQAAEHAVQANLAGDEQAIAVLERAGRAASRAGALATAVTRFDAAVVMAGDQADVGLLLGRAGALLVAGHLDRAVPAYRHLLSLRDLPASAKVEALWMLGRALVMTGDHEHAASVFNEAAALARDSDPGTAVAALLDATFSVMISAGPASALLPASQAKDLADSLDPAIRMRAEAVWGETAVQTGDPAGIAAAEAAAPWRQPEQTRESDRDIAGSEAWGSVNSFAFAMAIVERLTESERAFASLRASADRASLPEAVAMLANGHGYVLTRMGRLDEALEAINSALALADLAPVIQSFASVGRAYIQLYRGELDDSAYWCKEVETTATARGEWNALLFLWDAVGHRRLREGAPAEACEYYERLEATVHQMGIGERCLPPWPRHAIGAYLAADRTGDAERILGWLDEARLPCRFPRIAAAAGRGQLAELRGDIDQAEAHYQAALALHGEVDLPLEHCETLLGYGAFLRRSGRTPAARTVLAQAAGVAEVAGARWLADLALQELRVAGGRRIGRAADPAGLSAQEQRVATLAAGGASNAEIARQMYLSVRTVETHLGRIYIKLGIRNRYELIAMVAGRNQPRPSEDSRTSG